MKRATTIVRVTHVFGLLKLDTLEFFNLKTKTELYATAIDDDTVITLVISATTIDDDTVITIVISLLKTQIS